MDIVFATRNANKLHEIRNYFQGTKFNILSLETLAIKHCVLEDGVTFEENAIKKAQEISNICEHVVLSDDSGLEIEALGGAPGVNSAYFMGKDTPYAIRNARILEMMAHIPEDKRQARFVCVIAIAAPFKNVITVRGELNGKIAAKTSGKNGFGYDPIFFVPEYGVTSSQLSLSEKNTISHRGKALALAKQILEEI